MVIVDDSRAIQTIIRRSLSKISEVKIDARVANDGAEAFDIARSWEPDLIVTDWHMPNMNGLELLQAINNEMLGIKLGFVTSESSSDRLAEANEAGAKFIINKPFKTDELNATILPVLLEQRKISVYTKSAVEPKAESAPPPSPVPSELDVNSMAELSESVNVSEPVAVLPEPELESDPAPRAESKPQLEPGYPANTEVPPVEKPSVEPSASAAEPEPEVLPRIAAIDDIAAMIKNFCRADVIMTPVPVIVPESIAPPFAMAFFSVPGENKISAIGLMDMACVLAMGGVIGDISKQETLSVLKQRKLPSNYVFGCEKILDALGDYLTDGGTPSKHLKLNRMNVVTKPSPKLKALLSAPAAQRLDSKVAIAGYGHGQMILVAS